MVMMMKSLSSSSLFVTLLLLFGAAAWQASAMEIGTGAPTTLDATILLLGSYDWEPYASQKEPPFTSRCTDMVWRAAKLGGSRIQFVPTHYWRSNAGGGVFSYCWMKGKDDCRPFTQDSIAAFRAGMQLCFQAAADAGFKIIQIMPHLDSGDGGDWTIMTWRNGLVFDPRQRYNGLSYEEVMLVPLAQAVAPLLAPRGPIEQLYFALQGEMGATVMRFPKRYSQLMPVLRSVLTGEAGPAIIITDSALRASQPPSTTSSSPVGTFRDTLQRFLTGGRTTAATALPQPTITVLTRQQQSTTAATGATAVAIANQTAAQEVAAAKSQQQAGGGVTAQIKFGLTFNFVYSDGSQGQTNNPLSQLGIALFGWTIGLRPGYGAPSYSPADVSALIQQCDFIGVSAYASLNGADFPMETLQNSAFNLMDGFKSVGIDLKGIMQSKGAELQYVEFGVGGGISQDGQLPAPSAYQASIRPYWGVQGAYSPSNDPWKTQDMSSFRTHFYQTSLQWLAQGGGPTYGVSACFVWNKASWDVFGVYPESTTSLGSFGDPGVIAAVTAHNKRITGRP